MVKEEKIVKEEEMVKEEEKDMLTMVMSSSASPRTDRQPPSDRPQFYRPEQASRSNFRRLEVDQCSRYSCHIETRHFTPVLSLHKTSIVIHCVEAQGMPPQGRYEPRTNVHI